MKRLLLIVSFIAVMVATGFAQQRGLTCKGTVVDDSGEPIVGATVSVPGTTVGIATDIDGRFVLNVPASAKEIEIHSIGYKTVKMAPEANVGTIRLEPESTMLEDVIVTQSVARTRKTPVAISQVSAADIDLRLGTQEFPEVLKTTPGVWATKDGGGYGDAKINMRGFKSANTAMLVNGIPVNDMEWGGVYWSNWAGLSDVTSNIQTQRGLGAAILSAPSVGGTINITTRSLDAKKGGTFWYGLGNDGYNQLGISLSTGMMKNGWAVTLLGSRKWGDGYIQGTAFESWTWFLNVSKRINDQHQLSFTAFGSPQNHDQRNSSNGLNVLEWQNVRQYMDGESPYRYNPTFGYDRNGQVRNSSHNFYHKPQISLAHIWQIDHRSSLTTTAYVSLSKGGGYSGQGREVTWNGNSLSYQSWYGADNEGNLNTLFRNPDGTFAYGAIQEMNAASTTGSNLVMSTSNNSHEWYGLVSNYRNEFIPGRLVFTGGIDLRYYVGHHNNKIIDLYEGAYYMDDSSRDDVNPANNAAAADPNWKYEKLTVGDIVYRNYNGHTHQEGIYAQGEYTMLDGKLTTVLSGSLSNTGYWRVDHFYYDDEHAKSEVLNFLGGTIKAGANYNLNRHNNVFLNAGFISRAPFFSGGAFLSSTVSNATNPDAINEKVASVEVGYGYHSPTFSATVNAYFTEWIDRTTTRTGNITKGPFVDQRFMLNMSGVNARHMGIEINGVYKPTTWLDVDFMLSVGDWTWDSNATGYFYTSQGQPLTTDYEVASGILAPDHAHATLNQKGTKVGGSAQTTAAIGLTFKPVKGITVGGTWNVSAHNYSDQSISSSSYNPGTNITLADPWCIPWGNQFDLYASYRFPIAGINAVLSGNVTNLFNNNYIMDAYTPAQQAGTWENAYRIFYSFGTTFSAKLKLIF